MKPSYNVGHYVHWESAELDTALKQRMVIDVVPQVRRALEEAAAAIAQQFEGTPFAQYFAEELLIKLLVDLLTLSDSSEMELVRPALLADSYVRAWFEYFEGNPS